jgi:hypothetical protein
MRSLALACLAVGLSVSPLRAGFVTINAFNDGTSATVHFNDGAGHSGTVSTVLTQLNVTYSGSGAPLSFNTFCVDLFHMVSVGQTYAVTPATTWQRPLPTAAGSPPSSRRTAWAT